MRVWFTLRRVLIGVIVVVVALLALGMAVVAGTYLVLNDTNGEITSSGMVRKYLSYVPESYDPNKPVPLVISIHGFAEWPAHQMEVSHWNDLADEYGFIVVYPSGTQIPLRWNAYNLQDSRVDTRAEVQFIADLIDKISDDYNIDSTRVYANGLSNGAGMAVLLGCQLSERIAAIGSVSGAYLLPWDQCVQSRPVPVIAFHGTEDPIVPYHGGEIMNSGYFYPDILVWIKNWVELNGCDPAPLELPPQGEVSGVQYTRCNQNADVVFYTVHGGGHAWPGGVKLPEMIVGHTTQDIDATRVMWEFFTRYSL